MKKTIFYFILATTTLLGMDGCSKDTLPPDGEPLPPEEEVTPLTPDENGMVTLHLATRGNGWNATGTEWENEETPPQHVVQDLGNGYMLETELRESAPTRADDAPSLSKGVEVLMLAFKPEAPQDVVGYEVLVVDNEGNLAIQMPQNGTNYKLAFYSNNQRPGYTSYATWKLNQLFEGGPEEVRHSIYNKYTECAPGRVIDGASIPVYTTQYTKPSDEGYTRATALTGYPSVSNSCDPTDAIYALIDNVSTTQERTEPIVFHHLFSRLQWSLQVNAAEETIGQLQASFGPRYPLATLNMSKLVDTGTEKVSDIWSGGDTAGETEANFFKLSTGTKYTRIEYPAFLFMPVEGAQTYIQLNKLSFIKDTGEELSIDGPTKLTISTASSNDGNLTPGKEYNVVSKLTKKPYQWVDEGLPSGTWARSNIYWDGSKLTFEQSKTDKEGYQGVFFKFGSLTGVSPKGEKGDIYHPTLTVLYTPKSTSGTCTGYVSGTDINAWATISYCTEAFTGQLSYDANYGSVNNNGLGDICAYITRGKWRLPTTQETNAFVN
ncbi:MAG: hypothetical protein LBN24_00895, partial [Mediterranea sp.]|nr:hypothetical protein [Mediterranea sp.]